jgi:hypothetical protein
MSRNVRQHGFSLTETLLAVATLAVGLLFIGGTFMTGVYFSTVSTERTIGSVVADEAVAKIRLYRLDPSAITPASLYALDPNSGDPASVPYVPFDWLSGIPSSEYLYPSTGDTTVAQYSWAAICRRLSGRLVQVTVFISRETGAHSQYWVRKRGAAWPGLDVTDLPRPVRVGVVQDVGSPTREIQIVDSVAADGIDERAFISDGTSIVDDATGQVYRVLERSATQPDRVTLDRPWTGGPLTLADRGGVWVVPPSVSGGRNPLIAVYQQVLRF